MMGIPPVPPLGKPLVTNQQYTVPDLVSAELNAFDTNLWRLVGMTQVKPDIATYVEKKRRKKSEILVELKLAGC